MQIKRDKLRQVLRNQPQTLTSLGSDQWDGDPSLYGGDTEGLKCKMCDTFKTWQDLDATSIGISCKECLKRERAEYNHPEAAA